MILLILIIASYSVSQQYNSSFTEISNATRNIPYLSELFLDQNAWFTLGTIGLVIGALLVILLRYLGKILNSPYIEAFANVELKEFGYSFLILLGVLVTFQLADIIFREVSKNSICENQNVNCIYRTIDQIIQRNIDRLTQIAKDSIRKISSNYESGNEQYGAYVNVIGSIRLGVSYTTPFQSYILDQMIHNTALYIINLSQGISAFLNIISYLIAPLSLGVGAFLRPLPFFRKIGSTLIAIGVSFYLILPSVLILMYSQAMNTFGITYSIENCPQECRINIVGFDYYKGYTSDEVSRFLYRMVGSGISSYDIYRFMNGDIEQLTGKDDNNRTILLRSCNFYAKSKQSIDPKALNKARSLGIDPTYCYEICRRSPYPIDNVMCYFSSNACADMYKKAPNCFYENYNLSLLDTTVYLSNGSNTTLRRFIETTNCTVIYPLYPYEENFDYYCPVGCRGYYNKLLYGPYTEEQIQDLMSNNINNQIGLIDQLQGGELGKNFAKELKNLSNNSTIKERIISEMINYSVNDIWDAEIVITCGAMFGLVGNSLCYDTYNLYHSIKRIYTLVNTNPPNDTELQDICDRNFGGRGLKCLQLRNRNKPASEISGYPSFSNIYDSILFSTDRQVIIDMFRSNMTKKIMDNFNSINVISDRELGGNQNFRNIWRYRCDNGADLYPTMQNIINAMKGTKTDFTIPEIVNIYYCSPTIRDQINRIIDNAKKLVMNPAMYYGLCDPYYDYSLGCGYSDGSCPKYSSCNYTYSYKWNNLNPPSIIWRNVMSNPSNINNIKNQLRGVGLPIYPYSRDCSAASTLPEEFKRFPPSPDCSKCLEMRFDQDVANLLSVELGRMILLSITFPLVSIFITIAGAISISGMLGGEVFLPGAGKIR
jgi:hypothetical protein